MCQMNGHHIQFNANIYNYINLPDILTKQLSCHVLIFMLQKTKLL